jgi:hypothetical protein
MVGGGQYLYPEIPSYVGYVYRNKHKPLDSWLLFVACIYATKLFFEYFRKSIENKSWKDNQPQRTQRLQS